VIYTGKENGIEANAQQSDYAAQKSDETDGHSRSYTRAPTVQHIDLSEPAARIGRSEHGDSHSVRNPIARQMECDRTLIKLGKSCQSEFEHYFEKFIS
jgi:hypothetical protein